jgi:hypothetical protein
MFESVGSRATAFSSAWLDRCVWNLRDGIAAMGQTVMSEQTIRKRTTIRVLAIVLIPVFTGAIVFFALGSGWMYPRDVSVRQLQEHPSVYVNQKVNAVGYLVKHTAPHFGDIYTLCEGDPRNLYFAVNPCIAVAGASSMIDPYLSFIYNGTKYETPLSPCDYAVPCRVVVSGVFLDRGPVTDASQYIIEASSVTWSAE